MSRKPKTLKNLTRSIGRRIAYIRANSWMTQRQLASKVGTQQPAISRIEKGEKTPTLDLLFRISKALGKQIEIRFDD